MTMRAALTIIFTVSLSGCATPEPLLPAKAAYRPEPVRVVQITDWSELDGLRASFVLCGPGVCPSATPKTRIESLTQIARPVPPAPAAPLPPPEFSREALDSYLAAADARQRAGAEPDEAASKPLLETAALRSGAATEAAAADERTYQVQFSKDSTRMSPTAIQALYAWIQNFDDVPIRYALRISGPIGKTTAERRLGAVHQALRAYGVPVFRLSSTFVPTKPPDAQEDGKTVTVTVTAFAGFVTEPEQPAPAAYGSRGTLAEERAADSDTSTSPARSLQPSTLIQE